MKAKIVYEMPAGYRVSDEDCRIDEYGRRFVKVGTVFEGADVVKMIAHGCAEPADDEAQQWLDSQPHKNTIGKLLAAHISITGEF